MIFVSNQKLIAESSNTHDKTWTCTDQFLRLTPLHWATWAKLDNIEFNFVFSKNDFFIAELSNGLNGNWTHFLQLTVVDVNQIHYKTWRKHLESN